MQKQIFPYLEDYIEYLAGYPTANQRPGSISLARYDMQVVASIAQQTSNSIGFSDRQALLAHKLVVKYKRQLSTHGLGIGEHEDDPKFRLPLRQVDRSKVVTINNGKLILKFPYDTALIDTLREYGKKIPGDIKFNKQERQWETAITEPRVVWALQFADKYEFTHDPELVELNKKIEECQQTEYAIELDLVDNQLIIHNAESSLLDYIEEHLGGLHLDNLSKLVDQSSILGFTVSNKIVTLQGLDGILKQLTLQKETHLPWAAEGNFEKVIEYADKYNRFPIFVYDPLHENKQTNPVLDRLKELFDDNELEVVNSKQRKVDYQGKKCVYLTNWQPGWQLLHVPLLVTLTGLMIGLKKQQIIQHSEKIVFSSDIIYNPT